MSLAAVYFSPFVNESRAFRAAATLIESKMVARATFVGYGEPGLPDRESPLPMATTVRIPVPAFAGLPRLAKRSLQWAFWSSRVVRTVVELAPRVIHCHSLAAFPASALAARRLRCPVVYDAHELESERTGWGLLQKAAARFLERSLIGGAAQTIVVSESIARWYRSHYPGTEVTVIRNLPKRPSAPVGRTRHLRDALNIGPSDIVYLYLGAIGEGRGIELMLDAFKDASAGRQLVFMGAGPLVPMIQEASARTATIHWLPPVPPDQVVSWAAGADVGLALIEDTCLSYRYCLPNKLFECRLAGLPVIASDLEEMRQFLSTHGGGWLIIPTVQSFRDLIARLDHTAIAAEAERARAYQPTWSDEAPRLVDVFAMACSGDTPQRTAKNRKRCADPTFSDRG